jgi:hypothetical protein
MIANFDRCEGCGQWKAPIGALHCPGCEDWILWQAEQGNMRVESVEAGSSPNSLKITLYGRDRWVAKLNAILTNTR